MKQPFIFPSSGNRRSRRSGRKRTRRTFRQGSCRRGLGKGSKTKLLCCFLFFVSKELTIYSNRDKILKKDKETKMKKVDGIKCPHCGAPISIDVSNKTEFNCPYCDGMIYVDDGVFRIERKERRESYSYHKSEKRYIDEAEIEKTKTDRSIVKYYFIFVIILLVISLIAGVIGYHCGESKSILMPDSSIKVSFQKAILGKADKEMNLIVMEQELSVSSKITEEGLFDWGIFRKDKEVTYEGKAVYTVNLKELRENDIVVDSDKKTVAIYAPSPQVHDITIDPADIKFGETKKGLLSFGEIKFTLEEAFYLENEALSQLNEAAETPKQLETVNSVAEKTLEDLFKKTVMSVDEDYKLIIIID